MEDIFYHHVLGYISNDVFHESNLSLLCKNDTLKKKQKRINTTNSSKMLNHRFWSEEMRNVMYIFLDDYNMFLKFVIELLLKDQNIDFVSDNFKIKKGKVHFSKYVFSNVVYNFNKNKSLRREDFVSNHYFEYDIYICSVYRLDFVQKQIMFENCPHAKALIY